jgi:integrase
VIPYLFPIFPGSGIRHALVGTQRDNFERAWARACRAAGYPGRLVHDLRRSGIRNLVRAGVPERVVMSISGHRSRSTFDRYNITSETDLQAAAAQLDAARKAVATKTPDSATVTALTTTRKARAARS